MDEPIYRLTVILATCTVEVCGTREQLQPAFAEWSHGGFQGERFCVEGFVPSADRSASRLSVQSEHIIGLELSLLN